MKGFKGSNTLLSLILFCTTYLLLLTKTLYLHTPHSFKSSMDSQTPTNNIHTQRNHLASASSCCEMPSAHAIPMSTCVSNKNVSGGSSRVQRGQGLRESKHAQKSIHNFFYLFGKQYPGFATRNCIQVLLQ